MEAVHRVSTAWKTFGIQLGLSYSTLEKITNDHYDNSAEYKPEMLAAWLQQRDNVPQRGVPSWSVLQAALRRMGEKEVADRIEVS